MDLLQYRLKAADMSVIHTYHWKKTPKPTAVIQLVHGMSEHALRYHHLAEYLVNHDFTVFGNDHRGHGKTASTSLKGHYGDSDGWNLIINDLALVREKINSRYPQLPVFLLGHSMGSFMAQQFMMQHGHALKAVILSGSNYQNPALLNLVKIIPWIESKRQGIRGRSSLVNYLSFGSFNKKFNPTRTKFDWLSRDNLEVDKYISDPNCGFLCTNQLWLDFIGGLANIYKRKNRKKFPSHLPVYIVGGSLDPISRNGGLEKLKRSFLKVGVRRVDCKIYDRCRHEIFNETNKDEILKDLVQWLNSVM